MTGRQPAFFDGSFSSACLKPSTDWKNPFLNNYTIKIHDLLYGKKFNFLKQLLFVYGFNKGINIKKEEHLLIADMYFKKSFLSCSAYIYSISPVFVQYNITLRPIWQEEIIYGLGQVKYFCAVFFLKNTISLWLIFFLYSPRDVLE